MTQLTPAHHNMFHSLLNEIWRAFGLTAHLTPALSALLNSVIALVVSLVVYLICLKVLTPLIHKLVVYTKVEWDEVIFNPSLLRATSLVVFAIVLHDILPEACFQYATIAALLNRLCQIVLVITIVRMVNRALTAGYDLLTLDQRLRMQPLKGLLQMFKLICIIVGIIICVSILIERNPTVILTSHGASAAILMLVFKDTILGVVAGVQLSANDMLRKGDWIVVPGTPVNGVVQDVSLTTVKVQNFDNTLLTVPPYDLVSKPFQNWRNMTQSGGRRVMRSVIIDFSSVRFCTEQEMQHWQSAPWIDAVKEASVDRPPVNLTLLRCYMEYFLSQYSRTNKDYLYMVRQLEPTGQGVPLQVYCFTNDTVWKDYEHIQDDIFDHLYAVIPEFGLRLYQSPAADDVLAISRAQRPEVPEPASPAVNPPADTKA